MISANVSKDIIEPPAAAHDKEVTTVTVTVTHQGAAASIQSSFNKGEVTDDGTSTRRLVTSNDTALAANKGSKS